MSRAIILVIGSAMTLAAGVAVSQPDLDLSTALIPLAAHGAVVYDRLDGAGRPFTAAQLPDGTVVDATISLWLVGYLGDPIPNYPAEDLWLVTSGGGLAFPVGGTIADGPTDSSGYTHWQEPLLAGGCSRDESVVVIVDGSPLNQMGLALAFVSADLDGDLVVNVADLGAFTAAYGGAQDPCADLYVDAQLNLADLSLFAQAYVE